MGISICTSQNALWRVHKMLRLQTSTLGSHQFSGFEGNYILFSTLVYYKELRSIVSLMKTQWAIDLCSMRSIILEKSNACVECLIWLVEKVALRLIATLSTPLPWYDKSSDLLQSSKNRKLLSQNWHKFRNPEIHKKALFHPTFICCVSEHMESVDTLLAVLDVLRCAVDALLDVLYTS